jgi:hypothetical protein
MTTIAARGLLSDCGLVVSNSLNGLTNSGFLHFIHFNRVLALTFRVKTSLDSANRFTATVFSANLLRIKVKWSYQFTRRKALSAENNSNIGQE